MNNYLKIKSYLMLELANLLIHKEK